MGSVKIGIGFSTTRAGLATADEIAAFADAAEDLGIDSLWPSDHVVSRQPSLDTTALLAFVAARTRRLKLGPSVLVLPPRHPIQVAKAYATLDHLTGGRRRVILGVGLGGDPRDSEACGVPAGERAARMRESVEVMRKLWSGADVSHSGRFWSFEHVTLEPRPVGGPLDVWVGGNSDAALRRVARWADGWMPSFISPPEFGAGVAKIAAWAEEEGRRFDADEAGALVLTHLEEDPLRARETAERFFAKAPLPEAMREDRTIFGTPAQAVERLHEYVARGCRKFVLFPVAPGADLVRQARLVGESILPHFS